MTVADIIVSSILWNSIGVFSQFCIAIGAHCSGWELCNPYWVHRYNKSVNWFGATALALGYNLLSPVGALCYWFYKLCTVGRK